VENFSLTVAGKSKIFRETQTGSKSRFKRLKKSEKKSKLRTVVADFESLFLSKRFEPLTCALKLRCLCVCVCLSGVCACAMM